MDGAGCALVTGGRQGIGRGIALAFAAEGWDVVINDIIEDGAVGETLDAVRALGVQAAFVRGDVADLAGQAGLVEAAFGCFGGVDALVNNAGVSVQIRGDLLDVTPESFDRQTRINLRGPFFLTQTVARRWLGEAARRARSIITISSMNAAIVAPDRGEYCLSKAGVSMMTQLFAVRLAEAGIGVFEIRPGIIRTPMTAVAAGRYDKLIAEGVSLTRRWGEPADIGGVAASLASGRFHFSTGEVVHVDGGLHIARL
jgi:NAD(P)-dependent dehydrogenase (short-subunit alcohol dehydrogenase family)